ncbi:MAG: hypothetical protein ACKV0T_11545 [Planctomycetales bacterium]
MAAAALVLAAAPANAELLSISQLNDKVEQWRAARREPPAVVLQVEGRATPLSRHRVQFKNCRMVFESETELPGLSRKHPNLEVTGTVVRDAASGNYSFHIQSARELPTDLEHFLDRRRQLRGKPAEQWYQLAQWAMQRGEFYKDSELQARGDEANLRALSLERQELARDNPAGLLELADKARRLGAASKFIQELIHERLVLQWSQTKGETGKAVQELLAEIADRLPGSTEKADVIDVELQKSYLASPRPTYDQADAVTRRRLHRMLYADVLLRTILPNLAEDGSNGFEVAAQIDQSLPEQHRLAEGLRDKALTARAREVESLSRADVLALAQEYRQRQQGESARRLIESWLTLRRRQLSDDDVEGLLQLTDEYRKLLDRRDVADRLLQEAWRVHPQAEEIAERLRRAGYQLHDNQWLTQAEFASLPEGRMDKAIREGRIELGMTASQVRRSLGEPQRLSRSAVSGEMTEIWSYDPSTTTRLLVRLRRNRRQTELIVIEVTQDSE